jgi:hypothetical protein
LGRISQITDHDDTAVAPLEKLKAHCLQTDPGGLKPSHVSRSLRDAYLLTGIVYGLVNVRTNGKKILCATLNEADHTWGVKTFNARF